VSHGFPVGQATNAPQHLCIHHLLKAQAERMPDASAILAPGRAPLTYGRLGVHIDDTVQALRAMGVGRNNRVALVLPNGPEMAVAFLAVAAGAICAPLNTLYRSSEFDFYLADMHVEALIIQAGTDSPARAVARARGINIIELSPMCEAEAGLFTLMSEKYARPALHEFAQPHDIAVVLPTSGTTSRPKIVPLTQMNVCISAHKTRETLDLAESDRCLNVMPLFHPHGLIGAVLTSLMTGASVVCTPGFNASQFFTWLAEFRPTWYTAVPTIHQAILARVAANREVVAHYPLRFIRSGSAPLPSRVLAELEEMFSAPVIEYYGMTEAASQITSNPLPPHVRKPGSVGAAAGPEVAIMNQAGALLPAGATGEVVIRGPSVMQSYDNNPIANGQAFTQGWFRTGDQGFLDTDGYLFLTGRLKEFINRGGEKIAPAEVDDVLMDHPAVAQAVSFAVPHARLGEDIAAAVVLHKLASATESDIRQFAAARLAASKIPCRVLIVENLPKSPTGKLQRIGLAEKFSLMPSDRAQPEKQAGFTAPWTPLEEVLVGLWAQVLDLDGVDIHDNFFQLGGDSILATQLISRVREVTHVELPFHSFFETPTVAGMARSVETASRAALGLSPPLLQSVLRDRALPLSYAQQRLWFIAQLGISAHAYHLLHLLRLSGPLQGTAFARSLQEIVRRHEVLRTTFVNVEGQPRQVIGPATPLPLPIVELQELPEGERQALVRRLAYQEVQRPFDLEQGALVRAKLVHLDAEEYVLILTMHHLVSDGWSQGVFWWELAELYEAFAAGKPSPLPELSMQYADFAHWQRLWLQGEVLETQLAYWKRQLAGVSTLQLPTDYPRPAVQTFRGARYVLTLSSTLTQALKALSRQHGVTLFMTLLAAFQTLLHRYTGQDDIAVGSLIANRHWAEIERLIGFFVNTLVLRTDLSGDPGFQELLERVREVALGAYSYQDMPFEKLVEELQPQRDLSHNPLFQVLFIFQNTPRQASELMGLTMSSLEIDPETAKFDLTLHLSETSQGLSGWFEYRADLFEAATIARMTGHFRTLLEGIVANPEERLSRLPLLTAEERHRLLVEWNDTTAVYPKDTCLQELFAAQVERTPDAVAMVYEDRFLTYRELNQSANRLAHYLATLGVGPGVLVGLCLPRSLEVIVSLLGILKAGGVYLPLDPTYPKERLAFMLDDAHVPVLLTTTQFVGLFPDTGARFVCMDVDRELLSGQSAGNPLTHITSEDLAYVIYTSGSAGQPKGVAVPHTQVLNRLAWMWKAYPFEAGEVGCQKTALNFVDSIWEWLGPLLQGVPTVIISDQGPPDPDAYVCTLAEHQITRLWVVPSLLRVMLDRFPDLQQRLPKLMFWVTSGEAISWDLYQQFQRRLPHAVLYNLYGISEVWDVSWYGPDPQHNALPRVPIGHPIANMQTYILDAHLQPVPIGVPSELYVGGVGLARGYVNRPELTAEYFIPHPFSDKPGARLYKTGDLGRYLPDGHLEYLGRSDHQVKIRGFRIELGEIEAVLAQHPAVREAAVIACADVPGEIRLVAYMVPAQAQAPTVRELRSFLKTTLPDSMLPSTFVWLEVLPLTPSGKIDRRGLPSPNQARPVLEEPFVAPRTPVEQQVAASWSDLLGLERVGIYDNFFELGGHSLLATQLVSRLGEAMHVEVSLLSFFETPTVAGLANSIETALRGEQGQQAATIMPAPREQALPASITQEQIWVVDQVLRGLPLFNILYAMRLQGKCHVAILQQSCDEIIRRHEALRTTFAAVEGRLVQVIAPTLSVPVTVVDLRALATPERESEAQRLTDAEARQPFDLEQGPLLRFRLLHTDEQEHLLLVTLHHSIGDGWSLGVLAHELAVLYDAFCAREPSPLPELRIQYADFAHWQRQWRDNVVMAAQLAYWQEQLRDPLPALELPTDHPRGAALSFRTARQTLVLPGNLSEALTDLSHRYGSTLFITLVAAFKMLLYGYTGQEDLRAATLIANRNRRETEEMIGLFVNTVILRTDLRGDPTCREVLQRVRATTLAAYAHQDLPFEDLVQTLERERGLKRSSLCQVMFILQNAMHRPLQRSARTLSFLETDLSILMPPLVGTTFDVVLILRERPQGLTVSAIYKRDLFDVTTIGRMLKDFQHVLECLIGQLEQPLSTFRSLGGDRSRGA
jgi:amino acid adenylation domain-containing protein